MEPNKRSDIQDQWWDIYSGGMITDQWIIDENNNPLLLNFVWVEQDWEDGKKVPINFSIVEPNSGLTFTVDTEYEIPNSKGELISSQTVYWWEAKNMEYSSN
ncbi:hypothetical protein [Roseimarinus sediminis]|uniref:hypothetical protein n=1 Tax=Roseimarinus sediminis TaxID=1610899 RepID=UPI003D1F6620